MFLLFGLLIVFVIFILYIFFLPLILIGAVISSIPDGPDGELRPVYSDADFEEVFPPYAISDQTMIGVISASGVLTIPISPIQHLRLIGSLTKANEPAPTYPIEIISTGKPALYIIFGSEFTEVYRIDANAGWTSPIDVNVEELRKVAFTRDAMIPIRSSTMPTYKFKVPPWAKKLITKSGIFTVTMPSGIKTFKLDIYAPDRIILSTADKTGWEAFVINKDIINLLL